jgi:hypothetical protein
MADFVELLQVPSFMNQLPVSGYQDLISGCPPVIELPLVCAGNRELATDNRLFTYDRPLMIQAEKFLCV